MKEVARQLKKEWDLVFKPEGVPPYFDRGVLPEWKPQAPEFDSGNAWLLAELCRLVYTKSRDEARGDEFKSLRFRYLGKAGLREVISFTKAGNHASIFEATAGADCGPFTVLCYRGTMSAKQWMLNLTTFPVRWGPGSYVHKGFKALFDEFWGKIAPILERARDKGPVVYTGHSLGGALATLAAATVSPDALYTYGAPRVGNVPFRECVRGFGSFRVVNRHDIVTLLPHSNEMMAPYDFHHAGELHYITTEGKMVVRPKDGELDDAVAKVDQPLTFLMESFKSPQPPDCLQDHAPSRYVDELSRWV